MAKSKHYVDSKIGGKKTIYAKGDYYDWNPVYKTYNSRKRNELLTWADIGVRSTPKRK